MSMGWTRGTVDAEAASGTVEAYGGGGECGVPDPDPAVLDG